MADKNKQPEITVQIVDSFPKELSPVQTLLLKNYFNGESIDDDTGVVDVEAFAIMDIHNPQAQNPDYTITVFKTDKGIYYTSSEAIENSVSRIVADLIELKIETAVIRMKFIKKRSKSTAYSYLVATIMDIFE